jgi:hypothetical protein
MKPFGFEYVEVGFKVVMTPIIADHLNGMSQLLKILNHLPGLGRMP